MTTTSFALTALDHERRLFSADYLIVLVAAILFAAIGYSLENGHAWVQKQQGAVAAAKAEEAQRMRDNRAQLAAMAAGRFNPPNSYRSPANPLSVGNRHAATVAALPPAALAATSVGQSDLNPPYVLVSADSKDSFAFSEEIENPGNLLIGHFDLAFVVVFLLPLLILALSYNVLSSEREQGTLAILMSNPVSLARILFGKLLFRALLVVPLTILLVAVFLLMRGAPLFSADGLAAFAGWTLLLAAYSAFWFLLAAAVAARGAGSAGNALALTGIWIVFVLVLPTALGIAIQLLHPVPSRVEMINQLRAAQTSTGQEYDAASARYQDEHGDAGTPSGLLAGGELDSARKRVIVQQRTAERTADLLRSYDTQLRAQHAAVDRLRFLSPAIVMQEALNDIAGTGNRRHAHHQRQVDQFHAQWQGFFAPKVLANQALTLADYDRFPRFSYAEAPRSELARSLSAALFGLLAPGLLLGLYAWRRAARYPILD
jgi:ABC-2 type transport system permease protein